MATMVTMVMSAAAAATAAATVTAAAATTVAAAAAAAATTVMTEGRYVGAAGQGHHQNNTVHFVKPPRNVKVPTHSGIEEVLAARSHNVNLGKMSRIDKCAGW